MNLEIIPAVGRLPVCSRNLNPAPRAVPSSHSTRPGLEPVANTDAESGAALRVVVAYASAAAGLVAMRWLNDRLRESAPEIELQLVAEPLARWSDPEDCELAMADAAAADLLILASTGPEPLPASGAAWLDACLALNPGRSSTLVALNDTGEPWIISLEHDSVRPAAACLFAA